ERVSHGCPPLNVRFGASHAGADLPQRVARKTAPCAPCAQGRPSSLPRSWCSLPNMRIDRRHVLGLLAAPALARSGFAQSYPARPVKLIVPVAAGGANDTTARLFAQKLSEALGQQFYVENMAGGGGNLGIASAARASADGYTLLAGGGNFVINPSLYANV